MKILYVVTGLGGEALKKVVAGLADEMSKLGHQVKIAYLKGEIVVKPQSDRIELVYLGLESLNKQSLRIVIIKVRSSLNQMLYMLIWCTLIFCTHFKKI